ncbi:MAG: WYL domain-containing protein [Corynebacterium sp.]|nr:WYL domain-containing protein [Corynebacterium sp.]
MSEELLKRNSTEKRIIELAYTFMVAYQQDRKNPWLTTEDIYEMPNFNSDSHGVKLNVNAFNKRFKSDLQTLARIGVPIISEIDPSPDNHNNRRRRYSLDAENYPLSLRFTPEEATVVAMAFEHAHDLSDRSFSASAWAKIASTGADRFGASMGMDDYALVRASMRTKGDIAEMKDLNDLYLLTQAISEQVRCSFVYQRKGEAEGVTREFDMWGFSIEGLKLFVCGWDHMRNAPRVFRISNIHSVELLNTPIEHPKPADVSLKDMINEGLPSKQDKVDLLISGQQWHYSKYNYELATHNGEEVIRIIQAPRAAIIRDLILFSNTDVVLEPADLREDVIARLEKIHAELENQLPTGEEKLNG